ncbi:MAG TPA: carbonic anhydrase family protein [Burkholderiales bacterium]|nr:carbonic anhydrase family protein [Burkholderiales bacterium]
MKERRRFLVAAGAFAAAGLSRTAGAAGPAACRPFDAARQAATTPDEALEMLKQGNARFVKGTMIHCDLRAQVKATATAQAPFAAVVGCIDSRVPPELVFDQRIGDIFAARVAGNFVNTDIIGSLEFATRLAGAKLIVVLGHSECGAIKGAIDNAQLGNLTAMLANIRPAVLKVKGIEGSADSRNKKLVQAVADQNARDAAAMLLTRSEVLRELVGAGKLKIVSAMHDVGTGRVAWMA